MGVLYNTVNHVTEGFTWDDIHYLQSQVLTTRSIISEKRANSPEISHLFEAAKTMLTAVGHLLSTCTITDVSIMVNAGTPEEYPHAMVKFDTSVDSSNGDKLKVFGEMSYCRKADTCPLFTNSFYVKGPNIDSSRYLIVTDQFNANSNETVSYSENYPLPSNYKEWFRGSVLGMAETILNQKRS